MRSTTKIFTIIAIIAISGILVGSIATNQNVFAAKNDNQGKAQSCVKANEKSKVSEKNPHCLDEPPCLSGSIKISYRGKVTIVNDDLNLLDGNIAVGDNIRGFYCYDPDEPDITPGNPQQGAFTLQTYTIKIGNDKFSCDRATHRIVNDFRGPEDFYEAICRGMSSPIIPAIIDSSRGAVTLVDTDATVFVDDSLPLPIVPDLNEFEEKKFSADFQVSESEGEIFAQVSGTITKFVQKP